MDKLALIKIKISIQMRLLKGWKYKPQKIFTNHVFDKGYASRILKHSKKSIIRKIILRRTKDLNRYFRK